MSLKFVLITSTPELAPWQSEHLEALLARLSIMRWQPTIAELLKTLPECGGTTAIPWTRGSSLTSSRWRRTAGSCPGASGPSSTPTTTGSSGGWRAGAKGILDAALWHPFDLRGVSSDIRAICLHFVKHCGSGTLNFNEMARHTERFRRKEGKKGRDFLETGLRQGLPVDNSRRDVCNRGRDPLIGLDGVSPHAHDPATHRQCFRGLLRSIRRRHRDGQDREQSRQSLYREANRSPTP